MRRAFSIDGVDICIDGRILELRTEGTRTPETAAQVQRSFLPLLDSYPIDGILVDLRNAHYDIEGVAWQEVLHRLTRLASEKHVAVVGRREQANTVRSLVDTHAANGGRNRGFQSVNAARHWLAEHLPG